MHSFDDEKRKKCVYKRNNVERYLPLNNRQKKKIDGKNKEEEEGAEEESKISMCHYNKSRLRISVAD